MKSRWLGTAVAVGMWVFALAVYGRLPARMASHWNLRGEVDGWMGREGAFLFPAIAVAMMGLMWVLPRLDPRRRHIEHFRDDWRLMVNLLVCFFAVMEVATLGHALGWPVDVDRVVLASVGLMLAGIGNYLPRVRSNWFMGIRTPWTMDNERVWRATHRLGGRVFVAAGLVMAASVLLPPVLRGWIIGCVVAAAVVVPVVYSCVAWHRDAAGRPL
jgi:uncharacterized membrane protein